MLRKRYFPQTSFATRTGPSARRRPSIVLSYPPGYKSGHYYKMRRANYSYKKPNNVRTAGFIGKELKFVDYSVAASQLPNYWAMWDPATGALNAIAQGTGESQRIGRKVSNTSLHIRGILNGYTLSANGVSCRIVVFKDTQSNGAAPLPANVMTAGINGFRNLEYVSRFQVLIDKVYNINPSITFNGNTNVVNSSSPNRHIAFNVRLPGVTTFDATTASIDNITDVSYHVMVCSDANLSCAFSYSSRFRYTG